MSKSEKLNKRKFLLELIEVYRSLPALWDIRSREYSNKITKNEQYDKLLHKYREEFPDANRPELVKRINSLRTNFRKELKRMKERARSGVEKEDGEGSRLWYYDAMKFLLTSHDEPCPLVKAIKIEEGSNSSCHEDEPPIKKSREPNETQELMSLTSKRVREPSTEYDKIAEAWAVELAKMEPQQQLFAKKAINDILFEGQMGTLHRNSVRINDFRRNSDSNDGSVKSHLA